MMSREPGETVGDEMVAVRRMAALAVQVAKAGEGEGSWGEEDDAGSEEGTEGEEE